MMSMLSCNWGARAGGKGGALHLEHVSMSHTVMLPHFDTENALLSSLDRATAVVDSLLPRTRLPEPYSPSAAVTSGSCSLWAS